MRKAHYRGDLSVRLPALKEFLRALCVHSCSSLSANRFDAPDAEGASDRFVSNTERVRDLWNCGSRSSKLLGLVYVPFYLRMGQRVIVSGENVQIGRIVIPFVLVLVVDVFLSGYLTAGGFFCDYAMGVNGFSIYLCGAIFAGGVGFAILQLAYLVAEHSRVPFLSVFGGNCSAPIAGVLYDHMNLRQAGGVITAWRPSCKVTRVGKE